MPEGAGVTDGVVVRASSALYTKYRPKTLADVIGQSAVVKVLQSMVAEGRLPHALLFAGPHGTGKTSIARILAKIVNCEAGGTEPCNRCLNCREIDEGVHPDVQEMDAASNRGVDAIRGVRETIQFAPARRTRVIILDEAHQLTPEAANALLKSIEDPPNHCMFIFCTTSPRDILPTIRSRCYEFTLAPVPAAILRRRVESIVRKEGAELPAVVLDTIVASARGSVRDALSNLDKILSVASADMDVEALLMLIGGGARQAALDIMAALGHVPLRRDHVASALRTLTTAVNQGVQAQDILLEMADLFGDMAVLAVGGSPNLPPGETERLKQILASAGNRATRFITSGIMALQTRSTDAAMAKVQAVQFVFHIATVQMQAQ